MHPVLKWLVAIAALIVTVAVLAPVSLYLASEAVIQRRYPLSSTTVPMTLTSKMVTRGAHLIAIAGCADCHGADLRGGLVGRGSILPVHATNLRRDAKILTDGEFERAVRYGIKPDATSLWGMPSGSFTYMSEDDVASIVAYLSTLDSSGRASPETRFGLRARAAIDEGDLEPSVVAAAQSPASLDLGPRYDGGRYLARVSCGECHGTDLLGTSQAPDLKAISAYSRKAFFDLLRRGEGARGRELATMSRLARVRFHFLADYEIMALYDYLDARTRAPPDLVARVAAERKRILSEKALEKFPQ